ncbi:MAG: fatty acid desaturase [Steroidobacteraceae bacterium]
MLCFAYLAAIAALLLVGVISGTHLLKAYLLLCAALTLNSIRTLAAHRYGNRGDRMSHVDQFSDSINMVGQTWLTIVLFPVGLRYHALHHLLPTLPYHNLGKAHRRLIEALPADSPYHATCRVSFFSAIAELWRAARGTAPQDSAVGRWRQQVLPS